MKKIFTRLSYLVLPLVISTAVFSQSSYWKDVSESKINADGHSRKIVPNKYRVLQLDTFGIKSFMEQAPYEFTAAAKNNPVVLALPMPDGSFSRFKITKYDIMEPGLAAQFPYFRSYSGQGIDDPYATLKIDWNAFGFHAQVLSAVKGAVYIDPFAFGNLLNYISYNKSDMAPKQFHESAQMLNHEKLHLASRTQSGVCVGPTLRRYRLAVGCTGEYAKAATGFTTPTVAQTLSAIQTTVNRVNGVYETEVAVRMILVANETSIIYTTPGTGYTTASNNDPNILIDSSQNKITRIIGTANFDIGHTFSTGAGGLAGLGVVCQASLKASGITGLDTPTGDAYDIDYVAHEMGHEFGGDHTFNNNSNGSCNGNASSDANSEPGSGVTIMAYAGICGAANDLASHSIPYFHAVSYDEITAYTINDAGSTCPVLITTGNNPPVINAGNNYTIPIKTPFVLTGTGTDPDGDALTYSWEQVNTGGPFGDWNTPAGDAPIFRSFVPVATPTRYFPQLSDQVNNTTTIGELLPSYTRQLQFRLTGRDNRTGSGALCSGDMTVNVNSAAGPLLVSQPNTAITWEAGTFQTVKWDVARTDLAPVSCANVVIELSTDGGYTFPVMLAASTPNDGEQEITVPNNLTATARVRVKAADNIFYDMSNVNFSIIASTQSGYVFNTPAPATNCTGTGLSSTLNSNSLAGFATPITLSATGNPAGNAIVFSANPLMPGSSSTVSLAGTVAPGEYTVTVTGTAGSVVKTATIVFTSGAPASAPTGLTPANLTIGTGARPIFQWQAQPASDSYLFELSDNAAFSTVTISATVSGTTYIPTADLTQNTEYYWRVQGNNICGSGIKSAPNRFKTAQITCGANTPSTNVPKTISASGTPTITSTLSITTGGTISDVNVVAVKGTHTYVSDLAVTLTSPAGTTVQLFSGICGSNANFNLSFDDQAPSATIACPPTSGATVQPLQALSAFNGQDKAGIWKLKVADGYDGDGGSLTGWGLTFCISQAVAFPVNWLTFTGRKNESNGVLLQWSTASELNNHHYEIERSNDGEHYEALGRVNAGTVPASVQRYSYTDNTPVYGINYYRLKQVDKDGKYNYSVIVRVVINKSGIQYLVYPNPATDRSNVKMLTDMQNVAIRLTDELGKVLFTKSVSSIKNGEEISIPVKTLSKGIYIMSITTDRGAANEKIMVH